MRLTLGVNFVSLAVLVALLAGGIVGLVTIKSSCGALRQQFLSNNLAQADLAADFKIVLPIWVERQEGKGSRFSFSIPLSTSENEGNIIQNSGALL